MKKLILIVVLSLLSMHSIAPAPATMFITTETYTYHSFDIKLTNTKLNNPFNIERNRANKWLGRDSMYMGRFERFHSIEYGIRAGILLIKNYNKMGYNTIERIAHRYAPNVENNTVRWINTVAAYSNIQPNCKFSMKSDTLIRVCKAIMVVESSYK